MYKRAYLYFPGPTRSLEACFDEFNLLVEILVHVRLEHTIPAFDH